VICHITTSKKFRRIGNFFKTRNGPHEKYLKLVDSMPQRVEKCIANNVGQQDIKVVKNKNDSSGIIACLWLKFLEYKL